MRPYNRHIFVCTNKRPDGHPKGCCASKGSPDVLARFKELIKERQILRVRANSSGCLDQCSQGAAVVVYPEAVWYGHVTADDVEEIVTSHIQNGEPVARLRIDRPRKGSSPLGDGEDA